MVLPSLQNLRLGSKLAQKAALEVTESAAGRIRELLSLRNKVRGSPVILSWSRTSVNEPTDVLLYEVQESWRASMCCGNQVFGTHSHGAKLAQPTLHRHSFCAVVQVNVTIQLEGSNRTLKYFPACRSISR